MILLELIIDFLTLPLQLMAFVFDEYGAGCFLIGIFTLLLLVAIPIIGMFVLAGVTP